MMLLLVDYDIVSCRLIYSKKRKLHVSRPREGIQINSGQRHIKSRSVLKEMTGSSTNTAMALRLSIAKTWPVAE